MSLRSEPKSRLLTVFIPPLLVAACLLCVYAFNGIFPFGTESIVYDDMGQCSVPIFYTIWDALHANGSLLYNFRTAAGIFISGAFEGGLSPLNILFFLLCPRTRILESMSIFLLLKLMLASFFAGLLFRYRFRIPAIWQILLSVLYAFNPFVLQYYSNASWLELVMLLPLVVLGADRLMRQKKTALYICTLAYCLIVQLYIAYMIVLFLFLSGGMYIGLLLPKEERKGAALRFGVSSILALLLSAFSALPTYFYMTASSRYQNTKSYFQILTSTATNPVTKAGMVVILTALPFALACIALLRFREEKKTIGYFALNMLLFLLPVVFENINLLWHMGSYVNFSMRYAFLFHLMLLLFAGYALERFPQTLYKGKTTVHILSIAAVLILVVTAVSSMSKLYEDSGKGLISKTNLVSVAVTFCMMFLAYLLLLKFGFKRVSCVLLPVFVLGECVFYVNRAVTTGSVRNYEYSLDFIEECDRIRETLPIERDNLSRVKNIDSTLNTNYPLIADVPSMSNFTHTIPSTLKKVMSKLGYSTVYTRILDAGGTLFTDAVLGYRYTLSLDILPESTYRYIGTSGRYLVYENRYTLPFANVCSNAVVDETVFGTLAFNTTNNLWQSVSGKTSDLITFPEISEENDEKNAYYDFDITGTKELYLVCTGSAKRKNMQIYVNDKLVPVPSMGEPENTRYNTRFNNSFLDLGEYADTHITIRVHLLNETITMQKLHTYIALLDTPMLDAYCSEPPKTTVTSSGNRSLQITASADADQYLFLPITFDEGWRCTVNGQSVKAVPALGTFTGIPLESGENIISMTFLPKGMRTGIVVSSVGFLLCAVWLHWLQKIIEQSRKQKFSTFVLGVYYAADYGAIIALYIIPIVGKIYSLLNG